MICHKSKKKNLQLQQLFSLKQKTETDSPEIKKLNEKKAKSEMATVIYKCTSKSYFQSKKMTSQLNRTMKLHYHKDYVIASTNRTNIL